MNQSVCFYFSQSHASVLFKDEEAEFLALL